MRRLKCLFIIFSLVTASFVVQSAENVVEEDTFGVKNEDYKQTQNYYRNAPAGRDDPLIEPGRTQTLEKDSLRPQQLAEPPSAIEETVGKNLKQISLEENIQKQLVQDSLQQFGYELFNEVPQNFEPIADMPIPDDYVLGPGDVLVIQLFGKKNVEYTLTLSRDGRLLIPDIGPTNLSGHSFAEARQALSDLFKTHYVGTNSLISLDTLRPIRVMMVGDVLKPGAYTVNGLTTVLNALITTGGAKRTGSLRNIQLKRGGATVATFDLYDILLTGDTSNNIPLRHGDIIFIPPIGPTVGIGGEVQRPAIYELKDESSAADVIALAGGLLPTAARSTSHIERISAGKFRTLIGLDLNNFRGRSTQVQAGDLIRIFPVSDKMDQVVLLSGHVANPGGYQFQSGMRLSELIDNPLVLQANVDLNVGIIRREKLNTRSIEVLYFDPGMVLRDPGSSADLALQARDEIRLFSLDSNRDEILSSIVHDMNVQANPEKPPMVVRMQGHFRYGGDFPLQSGARLLDVIRNSGGIQPGTDMDYALISRMVPGQDRIEMLAISLCEALSSPDSEHNPFMHPEDKLFVFDSKTDRVKLISSEVKKLSDQTRYPKMMPVATIAGRVHFPGSYPITPGMRFSDLIIAGGGLDDKAYGLSADISRYQLVEGDYREVSHEPIELDRVLKSEISFDPILQGYDHLSIHSKPGWQNKATVQIDGQVNFPGSYPITAGETLCSLVQRAGGVTARGYHFGSVFIRQSVKAKEQKALDRLQGELDDWLVKLELSQSSNDENKVPKGDGIGQVRRIMRELDSTKAQGRLVIDLKGAAESCDDDNEIVLEDGDHLHIPVRSNDVTVLGEVYFPTTHLYRNEKSVTDYVSLSGGANDLGKLDNSYIVQADGSVSTLANTNQGSWMPMSNRVEVSPGATIYVPLNLDRINSRQTAGSWSEILYKLAVFGAGASKVINP